MIKFKRATQFSIGALLLLTAGFANATLVTWHDSYNTKQFMNRHNDYVSWTWNIKNDGFMPGSDWVLNYGIKLYFKDDRDRRLEWAFFDQPGIFGDRFFEVDSGALGVGASIAGVLSLNANGMLSTSLTRVAGDFYFFGGDLWAKGKNHDVPEPGLLSLFALGLLGLGRARRFKATV